MSTLLFPKPQTLPTNPSKGTLMPHKAARRSLLVHIVDLTRCCCSQENYDAWMATHGLPLGAAGIASYLARAAQVLAEECETARFRQKPFDKWSAREHFADILMASAPLSRRVASRRPDQLCEARTDTACVRPDARRNHAAVTAAEPIRLGP